MSEISNSYARISFLYTLTLLLLVVCTYPKSSFAGQKDNAPSKTAFIEKWEKHISGLDTTEVFEETDTPGIYTFKTNLFPYSGQLELLNVVISEDLDYYYNYDLDTDYLIKGVAEIKLSNIDDDFESNHYYSFELWNEHHFLFYVKENNRWLTADDLKKRQAKTDGYDDFEDSSTAPSAPCALKSGLLSISPIILFLIFIIFIMRRSSKFQKAHTEKFDRSLEMQKEQLELLKKLADKS
ncbi:MAG: hypothetical protein ACRBDL_09775 [Alphaproteobacteria bacterium]